MNWAEVLAAVRIDAMTISRIRNPLAVKRKVKIWSVSCKMQSTKHHSTQFNTIQQNPRKPQWNADTAKESSIIEWVIG